MKLLAIIFFFLAIQGLNAVTRREAIDDHFSDSEVQERLYAKSEDDENPPPEVTNPKWEFYQVTKIECQSGWSNMDTWEMADMSALGDCSEYGDKAVCFCGAQFSLQALIGVPLWICQHCDQWTNAIGTNTM